MVGSMTPIARRLRRRRIAPIPADRPVRPFTAEAVATDRGVIVDVAGEVDIATAPRLREALATRPRVDGLLLVDLTSVTFMDSSGLAVILELQAEVAQAGARLAIVCPPGPVRLLFEVTGVDVDLPLFPTREAALT
jgi:anti-sigma B factor antagonist